MEFLPHFPLYYNRVILAGFALLLGLVGGELAKRSRIFPQISGYIAVGFLLGPEVLNLAKPSLIANVRIFVDIALGLVLFQSGKNLDFNWLKHDKGILPMALTESFLTFIFVVFVLYLFQIPVLQAALIGSIAVATAPAVVIMIANDLIAKGPVTRRTFILTSINNFIGLVLFLIFLPLNKSGLTSVAIAQIAIYRMLGSACLALIMFSVMLMLARLIGKNKQSQFILFVGAVIFAIGGAKMLNISSMLTLFILGVLARNVDIRHYLMEVDFEWLARMFFIILFVITGVNLHLKGLWEVPLMVFAFIAARTLAKFMGIWLFSAKSQLTVRQTWSICLALMPMGGLAIGMANTAIDVNADLNYQFFSVIAVVAIMDIIGPILTQFALVRSEEAGQVEEEVR